ncbi:MAG TPA: YihY/virulence factor BrkB family protein [Mycobacteriales bacterium]|jgi:YihY family inner membrane protein|nr:YihY/virulence factor BrkB family protein [Mycobacteriales bacterium]
MGIVERTDAWQRRHSVLGFPIGVIYKFADDRGPHLAALITYYAVISLFPLLLLFFSGLGFLLDGNPELQHRFVTSALAGLPPLRGQVQNSLTGYHGSGLGLAIGIGGTLYGGLGVMQAAQAAFNRVYAVPRNEQPNPIRSRVRSLLLLLLLGGGVIVTTALSAVFSLGDHLDLFLGTGWRIAAFLLSLACNVALFTGAFQLLTARDLRAREVVTGGLLAGAAWQGLQSLGTLFLSHQLVRANELYGTFALVLGLIAWIFLEALVVVIAAEINVVASARLWPRALLTPFTDDVELTDADRRCYTWYARSERFKGTSRIDISFAPSSPRTPPGALDERAREPATRP